MRFLASAARRVPGFLFDKRTIVALIGLFLSVTLHELFHIVMHWGNIVSIRFLINPFTLVDIAILVPEGYDIYREEVFAYGITALVMLATIITIYRINDKRSAKSFSQLMMRDKYLRSMNEQQLLSIAQLPHLLGR